MILLKIIFHLALRLDFKERIYANVSKLFNSPVRSLITISVMLGILVFFITAAWGLISELILPNTILGLYSRDFWENVLVEAHGMVIELCVISILIVWLDSKRVINAEISRLREELEDIAELNLPEINVRKIGHIKRLNSKHIYDIYALNLFLDGMALKGIKIDSSRLIGLKIAAGRVSQSKFINVNMRSSVFEKATLKDVCFTKCELLNSIFSDAKCIGVDFRGSNLTRVNFKNCDLKSALFSECDLKDTDFDGANISRANFLNAKNVNISSLAKAKKLDYLTINSDLLEELRTLRPDIKTDKRKTFGGA